LLILGRRFTNGTWYIACVLCQLAAPWLEWNVVINMLQYCVCISSSKKSKFYFLISSGLLCDIMEHVRLEVLFHLFFKSVLDWRLRSSNIVPVIYTQIQLCFPFHMAVCLHSNIKWIVFLTLRGLSS
jgi:hypothetical protein